MHVSFHFFSCNMFNNWISYRLLINFCAPYFQLVNHGISNGVFEGVFKGISDFFNPEEIEDRKQYEKKSPTDRIRWGLRSSPGENREYLKVIAHPQFHCPSKPAGFRYIYGDLVCLLCYDIYLYLINEFTVNSSVVFVNTENSEISMSTVLNIEIANYNIIFFF